MTIKKEKNPLISIIIPCYNSEVFIDTCVKTLLDQSYDNWEAIFINDGSKDHTYELLTIYASRYAQIKVYTQANQGAAKAREYGLSKVSGDYILFLDVDDTLLKNTIELMAESFDDDIDIVVSGLNIIKRGECVKRKDYQQDILGNLDYLKKVLCGKYGWELWAKMFRRDLFAQPLKTPSGIRIGEDAAVLIQLVSRARKIKILSERLYNYIQYEQSASHVKSLKHSEETLQAAFFIEDVLKETSFYESVRSEVNGMFLLFYSNSSRKGMLSKNHPLVMKLKREHLSCSAFMKIPFRKAIYVSILLLISSIY